MNGRCSICGRKLTNAMSIRRGIGPVCRGEFIAGRGDHPVQGCLFDLKEGKDLIMVRAGNGRPIVNFPHKLVRHSPDGFEWGYGGSGPSELALNALLLFTDEGTAERLYQDFKNEFIANMPKEGGRITADIIRAWLAERI